MDALQKRGVPAASSRAHHTNSAANPVELSDSEEQEVVRPGYGKRQRLSDHERQIQTNVASIARGEPAGQSAGSVSAVSGGGRATRPPVHPHPSGGGPSPGQERSSNGPIQYDTRRTYLGTWNCGKATVTFDARGVSWLPAETFPTPVNQSYPLVSIPWSAITGGQIDKQNCSLVLWALHEVPFQGELFNLYSPMSDRHDPQSSIYIVMEPTQFHDRGGASSITQFLKDKSSLIAFVAPGKLLGRPPLRVRLIPGRV
jgi:hypothetical protein